MVDFDTLRRMWRCHFLRLVSFYHHVEYIPPQDMSDLWKQLETTHSLYEYDGQPPFPSKQTPDSANQYIDSSASAFLQYKDKYHSKMLDTNRIQSYYQYLLLIVLVMLVLGHSIRLKNKTYFGMVLLIVLFFIYGCNRKQKIKPIEKHTPSKILFYKDPPENDISYLQSYLPSHFECTKDKNQCNFILSTKFTWGVPGLEPHQSFLTEYGKQPKKVFIFWITDSNDIFEVPPNVYFFRTSLYRRWRNPTEDVLPFVFEPFEKDDFYILAHTSKPIIGFCGGSWPNRKKTLKQFRVDDRFQTLYVEHEHFSAGTREMYKENIQHSHFTICDRGNGNFTMRMWHVLSLGRVPVLVEEDMVFPFYKEIDWDKICVRAQNPQELVEKTLTFYHTYPMEQVQTLCWETYQKYFTQERYLDKVFSTVLSNRYS